jgi:hypothetical protein
VIFIIAVLVEMTEKDFLRNHHLSTWKKKRKRAGYTKKPDGGIRVSEQDGDRTSVGKGG